MSPDVYGVLKGEYKNRNNFCEVNKCYKQAMPFNYQNTVHADKRMSIINTHDSEMRKSLFGKSKSTSLFDSPERSKSAMDSSIMMTSSR